MPIIPVTFDFPREKMTAEEVGAAVAIAVSEAFCCGDWDTAKRVCQGTQKYIEGRLQQVGEAVDRSGT